MSVYGYLYQLIKGFKGELELPIEDGVSLYSLDGEVTLILYMNHTECKIPVKTIEGTSKGFTVNDLISVDVRYDYTEEFSLNFSEATPRLLESLMKGRVDFIVRSGTGSEIRFKLSGGSPRMEYGPVSEHLVGKEIKLFDIIPDNTYMYKLGDVYLSLPETSTIKICLV